MLFIYLQAEEHQMIYTSLATTYVTKVCEFTSTGKDVSVNYQCVKMVILKGEFQKLTVVYHIDYTECSEVGEGKVTAHLYSLVYSKSCLLWAGFKKLHSITPMTPTPDRCPED